MPNDSGRAMAAIGTAISVLTIQAVMTTAPARGDPLPGFCVPPSVVDNVCMARLMSVTADAVTGTITGTPVGGGVPVTLAGQGDAYLKSTGFGDASPDPVQQWDATIEGAGSLDTGPSDANWYGNAKAKAFLPRTLNELANQFPPDILVVRFVADDTQADSFRLVSIQPMPR